MAEEGVPQFIEEESEINLLQRMNSSLKKRSDSSHFLHRGGVNGFAKRPNSILGFAFCDVKSCNTHTNSPT
jgi:hypothetical protein